jgi:hypothetical protein
MVGGMTVREVTALAGACAWGPVLFLALAPAWGWAALAGAAGAVAGLVAGWACGWLLGRAEAGGTGASLGAQLLAAASPLALVVAPLAVLWLLRAGR